MGDDSSFIKIGPVGNKNGDAWDEKGYSKIVQIFICHGDEINSIQFQYVENGNMTLSDRHGSNDGYKFDAVKLNYPAEYITWISGREDFSTNNTCSITFGTNRGEYGPFGQFTNYAKEFRFHVGEDRQFGGFHGTADQKNVKSIGVYLKPNTTLDYSINKNIAKPSAKGFGQSWGMSNELQVSHA